MSRSGRISLGVFAAILPACAAGAIAGESAASAEFRIPLPESPPAVVILMDGGVSVPLPEPPPERLAIGVPPLDPITVSSTARTVEIVVPLPEAPPAHVDLGRSEPAAASRPPGDQAGVAAQTSPPILTVAPPPPPPAALAVVPPPPPPAAQAARTPPVGPIPQDILRGALQRLPASQRLTDAESAAIIAFYEARDFAPLWVEDGQWGGRARSVRARLAAADDDGLDPARYRSVAAFHAAGEPHFPALAAAEAQLTEAVLLYARDAAIGRVRPQQVHELITPRRTPPPAQAVLAAVAEAQNAGEALRAFNPPHPGYRLLREALAEARASRPIAPIGEPIPDGPPIRLGMRDPRVPLIRARLGLGYDAAPVYDRQVSVKVAGLQKENGLPPTGAFTPATRRALLGEGPTAEEAEIIANMEFWRWLPRDLGDEHIIVNAPSYEMQVLRAGHVVHEARTIVGKAATQTPFFSDEMDHIVVNPSWYVPPGILKREPKYLDPAWALPRGYEIRTQGAQVSVRQPPGAANALGYVKFMFPNMHSVYLHDTPSRGLFNAQNRALSNGCVRVENPFRLAALLFEGEGWTEDRFRRLAGGGERRMNLPRKMPIHLVYFTMAVDPEGRLRRHPDIYGHAARLRHLLGLS